MIRIDDKIAYCISRSLGEIKMLPNEWYIPEQDLLDITADDTVDRELLELLYFNHIQYGRDYYIDYRGYRCHLHVDGQDLSDENPKTLKLTLKLVKKNKL